MPFQDDPRLYDVNVDERIAAFIADNLQQAAQFRTNHIMLSMGADFVYSNANTWYTNMDKLIHYANKVSRWQVEKPDRMLPSLLSPDVQNDFA